MRHIHSLSGGLIAVCLWAAPAALLAAQSVATPATAAPPAKVAPTAKAAPKKVPAASVSNDDCLACHDDPTEKNEAGKLIGVDVKKWEASVHQGAADCIECHTDAGGDPHPDQLQPVNCAGCHDDVTGEFDHSVHAKVRTGSNTAAAGCRDCHGPAHDILASKDAQSRVHTSNVAATCGSCHGDAQKIAAEKLPGGDVLAAYRDSIHGRTAHGGGTSSTLAPTCVSCHGAHLILPASNADSRISPANLPATCGGCHQRVKTVFDKGVHGQLHQSGDASAPTCADCHNSHAVSRTNKNDWQLAVANQCGDCHADYMKSFRLTYHGKVTDLGYANSATCASCHGAHEILPASDPNSPIAPANRLQTCRQCHKDATAQFASWDPHPEPHNKERNAVLYYTTIAMNVLLGGVFLFFGIHTLAWAYRSARIVIARRRNGGGTH
jgi:hypothetical protein